MDQVESPHSLSSEWAFITQSIIAFLPPPLPWKHTGHWLSEQGPLSAQPFLSFFEITFRNMSKSGHNVSQHLPQSSVQREFPFKAILRNTIPYSWPQRHGIFPIPKNWEWNFPGNPHSRFAHPCRSLTWSSVCVCMGPYWPIFSSSIARAYYHSTKSFTLYEPP